MNDNAIINQQIKEQILLLLKKVKRKGMAELIKYLETSDFFTAPASTKYHGCYEGGLAEHSLNVYNAFTFLYNNLMDSNQFNLPTIKEESIILATLLHDACKIDTYKIEMKWYKGEDTNNQWVQRPEYVKKTDLPMGHSGKSIYTIQNYIQLTEQEAQAIFWHMGAYDLSLYMTLNELGQTYKENLLAFLLHQADMTCTYINENELYF